MSTKVYSTMDAAVADIPDGASIMIGGFGPGSPVNLMAALYRQTAKDLTVILNHPGGAGGPGLGGLAKDGRIAKALCCFTAGGHPSQMGPFFEAYEAGEMEAELMPQGTLAERIRAAGVGIPAFFTPAGLGTELDTGKEHRVFDGRTYMLEHALFADYAFLRAWKSDSFGNLVFRLAQRNFNPLMATAARCTIVEVEEPLLAPGEFDPDYIHTSGIFVHRIVNIPPEPEGIWDKMYNT